MTSLLGWLLVCCLFKEVYLQNFKCVSFWLHGCCVKWEWWARKPNNHTSWVTVVTPTDRPKSVRNFCVIELFCGVVCVVTLSFWHFCWCMPSSVGNALGLKSKGRWFQPVVNNYFSSNNVRLLASRSSHVKTNSQNDWSVTNLIGYTGLRQDS